MANERLASIKKEMYSVQAEERRGNLRKEAEERESVVTLKARRVQNVKKLNQSGVVDLLRETRDLGILTCHAAPVYREREVVRTSWKKLFGVGQEWKKVKVADFTPAVVCPVGYYHEGVEIQFDHVSERLCGYDADSVERFKSIRVVLGENDGEYWVDGEKLKEEQDLTSAVIDKIEWWAQRSGITRRLGYGGR